MSVTVSIAQINPIVGSFKQNLQMISESISKAKADNADVIIFPELALTGYPPEDLLFRPTFIKKVDHALEQIAILSKDIVTVIGAPVIRENKLYNMACVLCNGENIYEYAKQHLPNYRVFDEKRYFNKGKENGIIDINGHKIGLLICEDIWKKQPAKKAKVAGAELLLVLNASPFRSGKTQERLDLLSQRSSDNQLPIVYNNLVGGQDELIFDGESMVFNDKGELTFQAPSFESGVFTQTLLSEQDQKAITPTIQSIDHSIYQALVLGVKDYVNKNGFPGIMLGLSGGIDSALTMAVAVDALGAENVEAYLR